MNKPLRIFLLGLFSVVFAAVIFCTYIYWTFINQPSSSLTQKKEMIFEVTLQESFMGVSKKLEKEGLIKNAQLFNIFARISGKRSKIKAGEYALNSAMRPREILNVITSGISVAKPLTIPEGNNIFEIAEIIEKSGLGKREDFIKLCFDPSFVESLTGEKLPSLEGYLYPETYQVTKYMGLKDIISAQVKQFRVNFDSVLRQAKQADSRSTHVQSSTPPAMSPRDILILASIIEKETGNPADRTLISSVFHNRLHKKMKLQTDPTILYGKSLESRKVENSITRADLTSNKNPYSTYSIPGLPPGPISNPGKSSLLAAIHPANTNYLFFVSQNDGTTRFSETLGEHNKNVKETQLDPKAREGKSWRNLNPKRTH